MVPVPKLYQRIPQGPMNNYTHTTKLCQLNSIIGSCGDIISRLSMLLLNYGSGVVDATRWAMTGKEKAIGLRVQLDAYIGALNIALEVANLYDPLRALV